MALRTSRNAPDYLTGLCESKEESGHAVPRHATDGSRTTPSARCVFHLVQCVRRDEGPYNCGSSCGLCNNQVPSNSAPHHGELRRCLPSPNTKTNSSIFQP